MAECRGTPLRASPRYPAPSGLGLAGGLFSGYVGSRRFVEGGKVLNVPSFRVFLTLAQYGHWFNVMGIANCWGFAGKPS